jgi:hypothetical protein
VEDTLVRSGPGKTFAVAVIAVLPAIATPTASAAVVGVAAKGELEGGRMYNPLENARTIGEVLARAVVPVS